MTARSTAPEIPFAPGDAVEVTAGSTFARLTVGPARKGRLLRRESDQ